MDLPTISSLEQEIDFKNLSGLTFKNCNAIRTIIRNSIISEYKNHISEITGCGKRNRKAQKHPFCFENYRH